MPILETLLNTLPGAQRIAVRQAISALLENERPGDIRKLATSLQQKISQNPRGKVFLPSFVTTGSKISSDAWNDMQERMFLDLVTLYLQAAALDKQMQAQQDIAEGDFLKARAAIHKIAQQVRVYQFLKENPEYQDVRLVDFIDGRNDSQQAPRCTIDPGIQVLELPPRSRHRHQQRNFDLRATTVETRNVGGGTTGGMIKEFGPENILDGNPSTFWAELVLADGLVRQDYDASWGRTRVQGVVGEVILKLSHTASINNVRILPFSQFPVRVVDLAFKASNTDEQWQTVKDFDVSEATQGWLEFDFAPVQVVQIKIAIEQENYVKNIYHLPKQVVANQAFWEEVLDSSFDRTIHDVAIDEVGAGKIEADEKELAHLNALHLVGEELSAKDLQQRRARQFRLSSEILDARTKVMSETDPVQKNQFTEPVEGKKTVARPEVTEVVRYEYMYGLRQVELNSVRYQPFAYYSSPKMSPGSTVLSVELEVEEDHVSHEDPHGTYFRSSIEYEVQTAENKRFRILPTNYPDRRVPDEYIFVDRRTLRGWTRFPIDGTGALVRKNGVRMLFSEYTFLPDPDKDDRGILTVVEDAYDPNAVFTITYVATSAATLVDLEAITVSTKLSAPDVFDKTDRNNQIELSFYPYIEREIINGEQWVKDDEDEAKWRFIPQLPDLSSANGQTVSVVNGSVNVAATGTAFNGMDAERFNVFRVQGDTRLYKIASFTATDLVLEEPYAGGTAAGLGWQAGEGIRIDGVLYGLNQNTYEPLQIFVNDQKAFNLTNYETLEHQAFTPVPGSGRRYQYIHSGRNVYFNAPLSDAKIEVHYSWITQYLRLNAILRSNIPVLTDVTPKLVDYKLKLKTTQV